MRAVIKMGEVEYEGELHVSKYSNTHKWDWGFDVYYQKPQFYSFHVEMDFNFDTEAEALADAKRHGISIAEEKL